MGITQLVEFQSSKLAVAGSSPVSHSIFKNLRGSGPDAETYGATARSIALTALINADWIKHRVRGVAWAPATATSVIPVANAGLAQLVAQLTCNQWVSGSSPEAGTICSYGGIGRPRGLKIPRH